MAEQKALALINGKISEIPLGDTIRGAAGADNFSITTIDTGKSVVISANQQMLVSEHIFVRGHLSILGSVIDISARTAKQFFYDTIVESEIVEVPINMLLLFKNHLTIRGHLRVNGRLEGV